MAAYNTQGRRRFTTEARISPLEARVSALCSAYTEMISVTCRLERQFANAGDTDAARIANDWYLAALTLYRKAMRLGQKAEKHATRKRIERLQQEREDAWHKRMGWIKS